MVNDALRLSGSLEGWPSALYLNTILRTVTHSRREKNVDGSHGWTSMKFGLTFRFGAKLEERLPVESRDLLQLRQLQWYSALFKLSYDYYRFEADWNKLLYNGLDISLDIDDLAVILVAVRHEQHLWRDLWKSNIFNILIMVCVTENQTYLMQATDCSFYAKFARCA